MGIQFHACLALWAHDRNHIHTVHFFQRNLDAILESEFLANLVGLLLHSECLWGEPSMLRHVAGEYQLVSVLLLDPLCVRL